MKKKLTKEEKGLLIKDLLPRIPTDLLVKVPGEEEPKELRKRVRWMITFGRAKSIEDCLDGLIPYLRPLSSMTEEEKIDYQAFFNYDGVEYPEEYIDWLNAHYFDFRGLIDKGLAIKAKEGIYA